MFGSQFGTPGQQPPFQQQQPQQQYTSQPNSFQGSGSMFGSSTMSQPGQNSLFGSSASPAAGGMPQPMSQSQGPWQSPQHLQQQPQHGNQSFGASQSPFQGGYASQSPSALGAPQQASSGPRYMPGYLMKNSSPSRAQSHSFGSPLHHAGSTEDIGNTSMDREVNSGSPPITRGSIFGSASSGRNTGGSLFNKKGSQHLSQPVDDDAPPIQSLDDMDELPSASAANTFSPPKLTRNLSSSLEQQQAPSNNNSNNRSPAADVPALIIFGFSRNNLSAVLDHLSLIGPIASVETPGNPSANWATITFQETWQAARAVRRNGEAILNGALIIGVKWADPSRVDAQFSVAPPANTSAQFSLTSTRPNQSSSSKSPLGPVAQNAPQTPQQHQQPPPTVGTPVPILGSAYKAQNAANTPNRWSLGGIIGSSAGPQGATPAAMSSAQSNPFAVNNDAQANQQQSSGVWSKVSDAIFGF